MVGSFEKTDLWRPQRHHGRVAESHRLTHARRCAFGEDGPYRRGSEVIAKVDQVRGNPARIEISPSARVVGCKSKDLTCFLQPSWVAAREVPLELANAVDNSNSAPQA